MRRARVLVTGGRGTLARALYEFLPDASYPSHVECDVRDARHVEACLRRVQPDVVIHAAALTSHQHPATELIETNIEGTRIVALAARAAAARLVYLSTHYVYPGQVGGYTELSPPKPVGAYAATKLAGERWARSAHPVSGLIVRGSWYTPERVALWARNGVLTDAWSSREPVRSAARKISALVQGGVHGTWNIGRPRHSFADVALAYHKGAKLVTRAEASATWDLPYAFPRDASVSIAKFEAWWDAKYGIEGVGRGVVEPRELSEAS